MSVLIDNTIKLVEKFNDEIRSDLSSKGIDNTREASNSMRIEVKVQGTKINIISSGIDYMYYLDKGRRPGKFPPVSVIEDWVANKPVEINPYLVGRKIAREGTAIFRDSSKGIELDKKRKALLDELNREAPKWAKQDLLIKIKTGNKKLIK